MIDADDERWFKREHHFKRVNEWAHLTVNTRNKIESRKHDVLWILVRDQRKNDYFVFPHTFVAPVLDRVGTTMWAHRGEDRGQRYIIEIHDQSDGMYLLELRGESAEQVDITEFRNQPLPEPPRKA